MSKSALRCDNRETQEQVKYASDCNRYLRLDITRQKQIAQQVCQRNQIYFYFSVFVHMQKHKYSWNFTRVTQKFDWCKMYANFLASKNLWFLSKSISVILWCREWADLWIDFAISAPMFRGAEDAAQTRIHMRLCTARYCRNARA